MFKLFIAALFIFNFSTSFAKASEDPDLYWMKVKAKDKFARSLIANTGIAIEHVNDNYVMGMGTKSELDAVKKTGRLETSFKLSEQMLDFPAKDEKFHNYTELLAELNSLAANNPDIVALNSIGQSHENRQILHLTISTDLAQSDLKPGIVFMGGHHAREHVSIEMPLMLAQYLVREYRNQNAEVVNLLESRQIHLIPMVNPDGAEHDISSGRYKTWRKNRRLNADGNYGVDLNRNYGFMWGTGGSSKSTRSDVYMGKAPFSEPETMAIKNFVEAQTNISILLSFHTFSELILYPWGHKYDSISDSRALSVHTTMANRMAQWNGYKPQQSSDLYVASGDTTDWSFGSQGIISFTFELDPKSMWSGGFYPGQNTIDIAFNKNIKPALYLMSYADNPYRVLESTHQAYGLNSPLVK